MVAILVAARRQETRAFGTTRRELLELAAWGWVPGW